VDALAKELSNNIKDINDVWDEIEIPDGLTDKISE
jgi:hypothetical protein